MWSLARWAQMTNRDLWAARDNPFPPPPSSHAPCGEDISCSRCIWAKSCLDSTDREECEETKTND